MRRTTTRRARLLALLALMASAAVVVLASCGGNDRSAGEPARSTPAQQRIVLVSPSGPVQPSSPGGVLRVWRLRGEVPASPVEATVLSDEECDPDAAGISRCLNRILMPSGKTLVVRHPHDMRNVPCLAPGEKVQVLGAAEA
jgi:hypothetical protein